MKAGFAVKSDEDPSEERGSLNGVRIRVRSEDLFKDRESL
jgi:hypothetical protein